MSHISLSFSGSGNPNCFVNVLFFFSLSFLRPWVFTGGGTLTFLLVIGPRRVHLGPGQVSFLPADGTSGAVLHCCIPESLREKIAGKKWL